MNRRPDSEHESRETSKEPTRSGRVGKKPGGSEEGIKAKAFFLVKAEFERLRADTVISARYRVSSQC